MNRRLFCLKGCVWAGVWLMTASVLHADVFVMRNGNLLKGHQESATADTFTLKVGAGTIDIHRADVRVLIPCPPAEEPDTYLKAGRRATRAGYFDEAMACYSKSIETEGWTVTEAQSEQSVLRIQLADRAKAKLAVPQDNNPAGSQQTEAQRLIAEGEAQMRAAQTMTSFDTSHRGSSAAGVLKVGEANMKMAQAKIDQGKALLAGMEKGKKKSSAGESDEEKQSSSSQLVNEGKQWLGLVGGVVGVLGVLRILLHPFISRG